MIVKSNKYFLKRYNNKKFKFKSFTSTTQMILSNCFHQNFYQKENKVLIAIMFLKNLLRNVVSLQNRVFYNLPPPLSLSPIGAPHEIQKSKMFMELSSAGLITL